MTRFLNFTSIEGRGLSAAADSIEVFSYVNLEKCVPKWVPRFAFVLRYIQLFCWIFNVFLDKKGSLALNRCMVDVDSGYTEAKARKKAMKLAQLLSGRCFLNQEVLI